MCSYNAENGRPSCANGELLNGQLRAWSPDAVVSTDCGAINNLLGPPVNATVRVDSFDMTSGEVSDAAGLLNGIMLVNCVCVRIA